MDENQAPQQFYTSKSETPRRGSRRLILFFIVLILILLVAAVLVFARRDEGEEEESDLTPTPTVFQIPTDTPTPMVSPTTADITPTRGVTTPTATPRPSVNPIDPVTKLDRSKLTVTVLNGSGESGVAKKMSDLLISLGYNVTSSGNADNYNYTNTSIDVKSSKSEYLNLLKKDISGSYTVGSTSATFTGSSDARVIVGK